MIALAPELPGPLVAAARHAGVTRLGAVTGLDRLGVPVWQAIRPLSRAVSVHSGKGFDRATAMCGALGEAIESHAAEHWWQLDFTGCWQDVHPDARSPAIGDWWGVPPDPAGDSLDWTLAMPMVGAPLAVPSLAVSNDFTRRRPIGLIASSAGQAAGPNADAALLGGLLELIERDAFRRWQDMDAAARTASLLQRALVADSRAGAMVATLAAGGFAVAFHALPAAVGVPVVACTLRDLRAGSDAPRVAIGSAARLDPEAALDAAFLEAVQVRATWIAGSRDDLTDPHAADAASAGGAALPLPPGITTSARLPRPKVAADALSWLVAQLVDARYRRVAAVRLDDPLSDVPVMKLFVPGLRAMRTR